MEDLIKSIQISDVAEAEEILKSAGSEDLFEKAKWNIGDEKVYQGVTYVVGGFNAKGAPQWRKKKDGGGGKTATTDNKPKKSSTDKLDSHASKTPTSALKRAAEDENAPKEVRDAAKRELENRSKTDTTDKPATNKQDSGNSGKTDTTDNAKPKQGKWKIGDTKVYQGVTYEVGRFNDKGTPLWRKKKDTNNDTKQDSGNSDVKNRSTTIADKAEEIMLKNMTDKVMDKGFLTTNSKYNDKSKVELKKTDKGNWRCFYDGRDIGVTLNSSVISEAAAKKAGWYKNDSGKTTKTDKPATNTKTKSRTIESVIEALSAADLNISGYRDIHVQNTKFVDSKGAKLENGLNITIVGNKSSVVKNIKSINKELGTNLSISDFEHSPKTRYTDNFYEISYRPNSDEFGKNKDLHNKIKEEINKKQEDKKRQEKETKRKNLSSISLKSSDDIADFLEKYSEEYSDYQYGDLEDEELEKKFKEVEKRIKTYKQFDWTEHNEAEAYKDKMEKKGYKVVDLGEGSDTYSFVVLKK